MMRVCLVENTRTSLEPDQTFSGELAVGGQNHPRARMQLARNRTNTGQSVAWNKRAEVKACVDTLTQRHATHVRPSRGHTAACVANARRPDSGVRETNARTLVFLRPDITRDCDVRSAVHRYLASPLSH